MGNRLSSGSTGVFSVKIFREREASIEGDEGDESPVSIGKAVYTEKGEYRGGYNVTVAGDYALHVRGTNDFSSVLVCCTLPL